MKRQSKNVPNALMFSKILHLLFISCLSLCSDTQTISLTKNNPEKIISFRQPDDFHVHLRQGKSLPWIVQHTACHFKRAVVMPNIEPPIKNGTDIKRYRQEIIDALACEHQSFEPLMTFKITPTTTIEDVQSVVGLVVAGKLYPDGVTTNSDNGVTDFQLLYPIFEAMQEYGIILCLHGEMPNTFCLDREEKFLSILSQLAHDFPRLKIILEHISTKEAVELVKQLPDTIAATITLHHLELTLDDVIGSLNCPHHFCKPIPKRDEDRVALLAAALSGNPKFFFGSNSAPHQQEDKESSHGCAGIFSAPVAVSSLISLFDQRNQLDRLEDFISTFGAQFYDLPLNKKIVHYIQIPWKVPSDYSRIVPYKTGTIMTWQIHTPNNNSINF